MFRSIFRPEGLVWTILNNVTDVLLLSLLFCACSLPILTVGAAATALYDAAVHGIRCKEAGLYRRFFRTFRREFLPGLGVTLVWGALLVFGSYVLALLHDAALPDSQATMISGAYKAVLLIPLAAACWSAAILSRFSQGFLHLTKTAVQFLAVHLPVSAAIAVTVRLCVWFCTQYPLALSFVPALCALAVSVFAEPVFAKYGGSITAPQPESQS